MSATAANERIIRYVPRGGAMDLMRCRDIEVCLDGPAGTGKTMAALNKIHLALWKYPGARALVARKTNTALAGSAMQTFRNEILDPAEGVIYFGGSKVKPAAFLYPNGPDPTHPYVGGSEMVVNGLDKPEKVKSTAFDLAYINEATECTIADAEFVRSRLRNGKMPYQQLVMDVNPDAPTHWLNLRMNEGRATRIISRHVDNPRYWNAAQGSWTPEGDYYVNTILDGLTGVRRLRLKDGLWVAAEGMIYEDAWNRQVNEIARFDIPAAWPRYLAIDFGYTNPFVCQWWAEDGDGRLYMYREIYMSRMLVEDVSKDILKEMGYELKHGRPVRFRDNAEPLPRAIYADHDAEDRATAEKHLGMSIRPANKAVGMGIQQTASRMRVAGDGKPRLFILRDALVRRDPVLSEAHKPTSTIEEVEGYVWDMGSGRRKGEDPVKKDDHGCDAMRYICARELVKGTVSNLPSFYR